jgi:copper chaperone CopZ
MVEAIRCELCDAVAKYPVTKIIDGRELNFCCAGCLQVYELTRDEGLNGAQTPGQLPPKPASLDDQQHADTISLKTIKLPIVGMSCANCVAHVEHSLRVVPGVINVKVSLDTGLAIVEITPDAVIIAELKLAVKDAGYEALNPVDPGEK